MSDMNIAPSAITIGNFDGVHLGHQALINTMISFVRNLDYRANFLHKNQDFAYNYKQVVDKNFEENLVSRIITFSPHPATVLCSKILYPLTTDERRFASLKSFNPNHVNVVFFNTEISKMSCEEFCLYLVKEYNLKILFIGHDFKMGYDRCGFATINEIGLKHGFCVYQIPAVNLIDYNNTALGNYIKNDHNIPIICSSNIRLALANGEIEMANSMLGSNFTISGIVEHGAKRGGDLLGFPTANLKEDIVLIPKNGVYITKTRVLSDAYQDKIFNSVTNIGHNPTFGNNKRSIETFIMDFSDNLYGTTVQVEFLQFLRNEKKFNSGQELAEQIKLDLARSIEFFKNENNA